MGQLVPATTASACLHHDVPPVNHMCERRLLRPNNHAETIIPQLFNFKRSYNHNDGIYARNVAAFLCPIKPL